MASHAWSICSIPLFLLALVCSNVKAQSAPVVIEKDSTHTRTIDAIRDNEKASVEFRSVKIQVTDNAGKTRRFIATMLYDSPTRFFFWECFELYGDYDSSQSDAQTLAGFSTVYLSGDRLRWFHTTVPEPLVVSESANRYDTLGQAQGALLDFFKKGPIPSSRREKSKAVDYLRNMPRGFLMQCMTDINIPPRIESLKRQEKHWKLTVRAQNGSTAEISLDESYNMESVHFTLNPKAASQSGCGQ